MVSGSHGLIEASSNPGVAATADWATACAATGFASVSLEPGDALSRVIDGSGADRPAVSAWMGTSCDCSPVEGDAIAPMAIGTPSHRHRGSGQCELSRDVQSSSNVVSHDVLDSGLDSPSRHPRHAHQCGLMAKLADSQNALGVDLGLAAQAEHGFVTGAFAFFNEPAFDPPDHRMKPEDHLHHHVNRRCEVVSSSNVTQFVRDEDADLCGSHSIDESPRQEQHLPELPEVEATRRRIAPAMVRARITAVDLRRADLRGPFPRRFAERLTGQTILTLTRRAKYLLASLSSGETLLVHLGMSGSFRVVRERARPVIRTIT